MSDISIKDVAKALGISITTVSFVLNGRGDEKNISKETQQRVMKAAVSMGYEANFLAKSLKKGTTDIIGYIVPDISNTFFARIARLIEEMLRGKGYQVIIGSTDENPEKEIKLLKSMYHKKVDGIILASAFDHSDFIEELIEQHYPMVFFDRQYSHKDAHQVLVENRNSLKQAIQSVLDKGKKNFGFITLEPEVYTLKHRREAFEESLSDNHLTIDSGRMAFISNLNYRDTVVPAFSKLIEEGVEGIVCANNQLATKCLWALNTMYPSLIDQFSIISFDDLDTFDYARPKVISIAQPIPDIAQTIVSLLMSYMKDKAQCGHEIWLEPSIKYRN